MMRRLGRWAIETRSGRALTRAGAVLAILGGAYAVIWEEVHRQVDRETNTITQRVETIERVEPEDVIRECLQTPKCRRLLANASDQLQTNSKKLRSLEQDEVQRSGPDVRTGGGQESGQGGGHPKGGSGPRKPPKATRRAKSPARAEGHSPGHYPPSSQPNTPSVLDQFPPAAPGKSGDTRGAGNGTKACVELVVTACINAPGLP